MKAPTRRASLRSTPTAPRSSSRSSASKPTPPPPSACSPTRSPSALLPDVEPLLAGLARAEVPAAVVSNWDCTLRRTLTRLGLELDAIVTCGETGVRKPDPRVFLEALGRLGVAPDRALHVGDSRRYRCGGRRGCGHRCARRGSHRRIRRPGYHRIVDRGAGAPVNDRRLGTAAVHAGRLPTLPGDPVVEPVHRSVIYEFESAAEFGAIMADERRGYLYTRIRNPSTDELAAVIAELEGAETAHCFASGMAALTALIGVMAPPGAGVVAARADLRTDAPAGQPAPGRGALRRRGHGRPAPGRRRAPRSSWSRRSRTRTWRSPTCRRSARSRTPLGLACSSTTPSRRR